MSQIFKMHKLNFLRFIILLWLMIHFALTLIYVLPTNPLRDTLGPFLNATIGAYFPQDWNLFAPVPRTADLALLVRPLNKEEMQAIRTQGLPKNGWYDLSAPLWAKFQSNRFSAYNKLGRPADQAIVHYLNQPQKQSIQLMVKVASAFCKDIGQSHAGAIALMIYERLGKSWPDREITKPRTIKIILVGVYPIDRSVERMNLYQTGGTHGDIP